MSIVVDNTGFTHNLQTLGLDETESRIYRALLEQGVTTLLSLSRIVGLPRSTVYRICNDLNKKQFVEYLLSRQGKKVKAIAPADLMPIVDLERVRLREMESAYKDLQTMVVQLPVFNQTEVKYFSGREGIRQMLWNELQTKDELVGYTFRVLYEPTGDKFFEEYSREFAERKIKSRDIRGDEFIRSKGVEDSRAPWFVWRYLPDEVLQITHGMDIYNDVVAIYSWQGSDVFGLEIHNPVIAKMQRSIFQTFWNLAAKYPKPGSV